jgi:hypothetical protein
MVYDLNDKNQWSGTTGIYGVCLKFLNSDNKIMPLNYSKCCDNSCSRRFTECQKYCKMHKYKDCEENCQRIRKSCKEICYYHQPNIVEGWNMIKFNNFYWLIIICICVILFVYTYDVN